MSRGDNHTLHGKTGDPGISLELLESFTLVVRGREVPVSDGSQRLVALLALKGRPLRRSLIAGTLWPEKAESRAIANLRSSLWRLHGASPGLVDAIVCTGSSLMLNPGVELDVTAIERQGWALLDGGTAAYDRQAPDLHSLDLFSRELLPGWYEDWVIVERERLTQLQIRFLEALVTTYRDRGDSARAVDLAMRLVAKDPLREPSQQALVRALLAEGDWGRAHLVAAHYCRLVEEVFGRGASDRFATTYRSLVPSAPGLVRS